MTEYSIYKIKKLIIFDLDGTLTVSKSSIDQEMAGLLGDLLKTKIVAVIGGGQYAQFEKQFLNGLSLSDELLKKLFLFPTSGSAFFKHGEQGWEKVYEELLTEEEKAKVFAAFDKVLKEIAHQPPEVLYGERLEDRRTQITFSMVGQNAPVKVKEEFFEARDTERRTIRDMLAAELPDLEVRIGGLTSIDVTRKGIDKAYGIHKIETHLDVAKSEMLFIGDAIYPGGNDYAAVTAGVDYVKISGPEETKTVIRALI